MKKDNTAFIIISIIIIVIITALLIYWKFTHMTIGLPTRHKDKIFLVGDAKEIRQYLDSEGSTIGLGNFYALIRRERADLLEILLKEYKLNPNFGAKYKDDTPLLFAAEELKRSSVEILIKYGADINYKNAYGNTALVIAAEAAFAMPVYKYSSREISKILIDAGADVNVVGEWSTPIGGAISSRDMANVKYMVEHDGDVNYISKSGSNYLVSCFSLECIEYFLEKGLLINSIDNNGKNLLQSSVYIPSNNTMKVKRLLEWGADICHKDNEGLTVLDHAQEANLNPHLHKDNPEFYQKKLAEHRNTEVYKYLEKEYNKKCLKIN